MNNNKRSEAVIKCRAKLKRVEIMLKPDEYDNLKNIASDAQESISSFVKKAIQEKIEREACR